MYSDDDIKRELRKNIKQARVKANLTQDQLAEKVDLSVQFIRDIESGKNVGSVVSLLNIFRELNLTPNQVFRKLINIKPDNNEDIVNKIYTLNEHDRNIIIKLLEYMDEN